MTFTEPDEATNFSLEVFDVATSKRSTGPLLFQRLPGAAIPDQVISGLDGSAFRVVVEATSTDGLPVGTLDRTLPADSQQLTVTFTQLPILPPTAEIGRISASVRSGDSNEPAISRDGRFVAFSSVNPGLVPGTITSTPARRGIFLRDRQNSTTQRIGPGAPLSTFTDGTSNTILFGETSEPESRNPDLSGDGRVLVYEKTLSGVQIMVFDRDISQEKSITPALAPVGTGLLKATGGVDPSISDSGRFITYTATITNQPNQIALFDRESQSTGLISKTAGAVLADRSCANPILSPDGNLIFFSTTASNLGGGQGGLFAYDILNDSFARLSSPSPFRCSVSNDGRFVTANIDNR